jgi:hypothetical protein
MIFLSATRGRDWNRHDAPVADSLPRFIIASLTTTKVANPSPGQKPQV